MKKTIFIKLFLFISVVIIFFFIFQNNTAKDAYKEDNEKVVDVEINLFDSITHSQISKNTYNKFKRNTLKENLSNNTNVPMSHEDTLKALRKQYNKLKSIFNDSNNPNIIDSYGNHILWYAIIFSDQDMVHKLIENNLSLNKKIASKAIFFSIANDIFLSDNDNKKSREISNKNIFVLLLENDIDISDNVFSEDTMLKKYTPLTLSARFNNIKSMKLLLDNGVDIDGATKSGKTVLMEALEQNNKEMISFLLKNDSDKNMVQNNSKSVYAYALESADLSTIKILDPEEDYTVNLLSTKNTNALMFVSRKGNKEVIQYYLDKGLNINHVDDRGYTPLVEAVVNSNFEATKYLMQKGADVDVTEGRGRNLLHLASIGGSWDLPEYRRPKVSYEMMEHIYSKGDYEVDAIDNIGSTALLNASGSNNIEAVKFLLDKGASKEIVNKRGHTALTAAKYFSHDEVVDLLINYSVKK